MLSFGLFFPIQQQLAQDPNKDDEVLKMAIGLVGDLAQALGPAHVPHLRTNGVLSLINVSFWQVGLACECYSLLRISKPVLYVFIRPTSSLFSVFL